MRVITGVMVVVLGALPAKAVVLGQVDTFQDGSMQDWVPYPSGVVEPSGGPGGTGDGYLRLTANNRPLDAYNRAHQWSGDYLAAGVDAIAVDLANFGPSALEIRVQLEGGSIFQSTQALVLPPSGQWQHAVFSLARADMTLVHQKVGDYTTTMSSLYGLHFRHQPGVPNNGDISVDSVLGIDNISAIPEPCSLAGLILMGACAIRRP